MSRRAAESLLVVALVAILAILVRSIPPVTVDGVALGMTRSQVQQRLGRATGTLEENVVYGSTVVGYRLGRVYSVTGTVLNVPGVAQLRTAQPFDTVQRLGEPDPHGCGHEGVRFFRYRLWVERDCDHEAIGEFHLYEPE